MRLNEYWGKTKCPKMRKQIEGGSMWRIKNNMQNDENIKKQIEQKRF